eukprot:jgi/Ulvmu1/5635/UM023_0175.1
MRSRVYISSTTFYCYSTACSGMCTGQTSKRVREVALAEADREERQPARTRQLRRLQMTCSSIHHQFRERLRHSRWARTPRESCPPHLQDQAHDQYKTSTGQFEATVCKTPQVTSNFRIHNSQVRSIQQLHRVGGVRLLAAGHASRPVSAKLVQAGTPAKQYSTSDPKHNVDAMDAGAYHGQSSGCPSLGVRLLKARPVYMGAPAHDPGTRHAAASTPLVSLSDTLEPRLKKLPVQVQPHLQSDAVINNAARESPHQDDPAGPVIARSLRTAAHAATNVIEMMSNDSSACGDHHQCGFDAAHTRSGWRGSSQPMLQDAPAQPGVRLSHQGSGKDGARKLRPSMANRLIELTTMQSSQAATTSRTATSKLADKQQELRANTPAQTRTGSDTAPQLPVDTLMQVVSVGKSRAASEQDPCCSAATSRRTSATTIVACPVHRSLNPAQLHSSREAAGGAHRCTSHSTGKEATSAAIMAESTPAAGHSKPADAPEFPTQHQHDAKIPAAKCPAATAATSSAVQPLGSRPAQRTCDLARLAGCYNGSSRFDVSAQTAVLQATSSGPSACSRTCKSSGAVELTGLGAHTKALCAVSPTRRSGEIGEDSCHRCTSMDCKSGTGGDVSRLLEDAQIQSCHRGISEGSSVRVLQGRSGNHVKGFNPHVDPVQAAACDATSSTDHECFKTSPDGYWDGSRQAQVEAECQGHNSANEVPFRSPGATATVHTALHSLAVSQQLDVGADTSFSGDVPAPKVTSEVAASDAQAFQMQCPDSNAQTLLANREISEGLLRDTHTQGTEVLACGTESDCPGLIDAPKEEATASELSGSTSVHSSPRIQAVAQTGLRSGSQSPLRKTVGLQFPMSPRGLLELQDQIERRAQKILNSTPDAPNQVQCASGDCEITIPAPFEHIHTWLLEPGSTDVLFRSAETAGAGTLAQRVHEAVLGTSQNQLERGYLQASLVAGSILSNGVPTLFENANDFKMSRSDLLVAVEDCARAGRSSAILVKEMQVAIHASAWGNVQVEPIATFNAIDWEGRGHINMVQLCHLLVTWHNFDSGKSMRKSTLSLRRLLAAAFQQAYLQEPYTDAFTWDQVCRLLGVKQGGCAASDLIAEAKEAGRNWAQGTATSALDTLRHAQGLQNPAV